MRKAILIDGSNLWATARQMEVSIDFKKLKDLFPEDNTQFFYFTALPPKEVHSDLRPMIDWMQYNGYNMILKDWKEYQQENGSIKRKGNVDVDIAVYALRLAESVDHIVLFSGDGDFQSLVKEVQMRGVKVSAYSSLKFKMIADELRRQVNEFVELADMLPRIANVAEAPPRKLNVKFNVLGGRK